VETFGAPIIDQEANRELFEEQVEIVFKRSTTNPFRTGQALRDTR